MPASMASITAALVYGAGTKITDTVAPVACLASRTELKTGIGSSSTVTEVPPLPGVTPAVTRVPNMTMRWVCLRPSVPVIP